MRIDKCEPGYIKSRIKVSFLWLFVYIVFAVAVFLTGYLWTHTRANVFTVVAILMALPAAKRIVNLVVFLPRKSVESVRVEQMQQAAGENILFTDYVFTSSEKVMHLDFLLIREGNVLAVMAPSKQDTSYTKNFLEESVHKLAPAYRVSIFKTDEELFRRLKTIKPVEEADKKEKKVEEFLHSLAV